LNFIRGRVWIPGTWEDMVFGRFGQSLSAMNASAITLRAFISRLAVHAIRMPLGTESANRISVSIATPCGHDVPRPAKDRQDVDWVLVDKR
jgi:hypothetical protein